MSALITAENVSRAFGARGLFRRGGAVQAVAEVSLAINRGEAVGLVGESGSGKSTIGRLMLGLLPPSAGRVALDGIDLAGLRGAKLRTLRRRAQLVFQDPNASLDPRRRIGPQIADGLAIHRLAPPADRPARVAALLEQVGLPAAHADRYPHQFSGGQRQRIAIARALATGPEFLVADEPVSALDVSVQAQVLRLLADLRSRLGLAMLFISHDLAVVRALCDRVVVLYLGRVMEEGPAAEVLRAPRHPYTRVLLGHLRMQGEPPSPAAPPPGCVFHTRCPLAVAECRTTKPGLQEVENQHRVACIRQ